VPLADPPMTSTGAFTVELEVATVSRTLMASGYEITDARRQPRALLVECQRLDVFGLPVSYLIVICDGPRASAGPRTSRGRCARWLEREP